MKNLWAFTITHKEVKVDELGHMMPNYSESVGKPAEGSNDLMYAQLSNVKQKMGIDELFFLPTCNRILFVLYTSQTINQEFIEHFYNAFHAYRAESSPNINTIAIAEGTTIANKPRNISMGQFAGKTQIYSGLEVVEHLFKVASSIDSMVVGEREILGQIKGAYETCRQHKLTGDKLRLLIQSTVLNAKEVFTETTIGEQSVSMVSLSVQKLLKHIKLANHADPTQLKIWLLGAGQSNRLAAKLLVKEGFNNFVVINRGETNGKVLADKLNAPYYPISQLNQIDKDLDVLYTCTAARKALIDNDFFDALDKKIVVADLAVPADIATNAKNHPNIFYFDIEDLRNLSQQNLDKRSTQIASAEIIIDKNIAAFQMKFRRRNVEKAMTEIPVKLKEVKERAYEQVFQKEIESLDAQSKETLDKVVAYLEKKYIGIPIAIAKKALEEELSKED